MGAVQCVLSNAVQQSIVEYSSKCGKIGVACSVEFEVAHDITEPIHVYYQLTNFYQNHRLYAKSLSTWQLKGCFNFSAGHALKTNQLGDCHPIITMKELGRTKSVNGRILSGEDPANPCGLIAKSLFNGLR